MDYHIDKLAKRSSTKSFTDLKQTPVILACIYNKNGIIFTHDYLRSLFSSCGHVLRILIFEKLKVWKTFIEFSNVEGAIAAKNHLDNFVLHEDGSRMNIYFSNLDTIKFQNNNSGGIDYTLSDNFKSFSKSFISKDSNDSLSTVSQRSREDIFFEKQGSFMTDQDEKENEIFKIIANSSKQQQQQNDDQANKLNEHETEYEEPDADHFNSFLDKPFLFHSQTNPNQHQFQKKNKHNNTSGSYNNLCDTTNQDSNNNIKSTESEEFKSFTSALTPNKLNSLSMTSSLPLKNNTQGPSLKANMGFITQPVIMQPSTSTSQEKIIPKPPGLEEQNSGNKQKIFEMIDADIVSSLISKIQANLEELDQSRNYNCSNLDSNSKTYIPPSVLDVIRDNFEKSNFENSIKDSDNKIITFGPDDNNPNIQCTNDNNLNINNLNISTLNDLKNLDRNTLTQLYQNLSVVLGVNTTKSPVLYIRGLEHRDLRVQMIYNIFSNFGNILKIIFIRPKSAALIEFENNEYSTISKDFLSNIIFMGKSLRIYYSNYSMINLNKKTNKDFTTDDILICNPKNFRFKKCKGISINPPSATLHVSNLIREVCYEDIMKPYFSVFGKIEGMKFLFMENNKNMCLIKMGSVEEALNAMAYLHDADLGGRKIQISFTRSKV